MLQKDFISLGELKRIVIGVNLRARMQGNISRQGAEIHGNNVLLEGKFVYHYDNVAFT